MKRERERKHTIHAFFNGTMWSISTSAGAVHLPPVVGRRPGAAGRVAVGADDDARPVALEHVLARVARPLDGDPRREQVPLVKPVVGVCGYRQSRELRLRAGGCGDAGLCGGLALRNSGLGGGEAWGLVWVLLLLLGLEDGYVYVRVLA